MNIDKIKLDLVKLIKRKKNVTFLMKLALTITVIIRYADIIKT